MGGADRERRDDAGRGTAARPIPARRRRADRRDRAQRRRGVLANRGEFAARFPAWPADRRLDESDAWVALALTASTGAPIGSVALGFAGERAFDADVRRYVAAIIDQAALAFERV